MLCIIVLFILFATTSAQNPAEIDDYYDYYVDEPSPAVQEQTKPEKLVIPSISIERVQEVLQSTNATRAMVDCILVFEPGCPEELEGVNKLAPEIFRRGGRCFHCSKSDQNKLRAFLFELQKRQPREYRRLIQELNQI